MLVTAQVMVVPISEASLEYAQQVRSQLRKAKLHVDVDATDRKMQKKVREAQLAQYNYILVSCLLPIHSHSHEPFHANAFEARPG